MTMESDESALVREQLNWAQVNLISDATEDKACWFDRTLDSQVVSKFRLIREPNIRAGEDLSASDPMREPDDIDVVFRLCIDDQDFIFKRVRSDRVPTRFHEAFVASAFGKSGIKVVRHVAIIEFIDTSTAWLIMRDEGFKSMRSVLREEVRDAPNGQDRESLYSLLYNCGAAVRTVLSCHLRYEDLDFKNILVGPAPFRRISFCDFERTRYRVGNSEPMLTTELAVAICRRLKRMSIPADAIRYLFAGVLNRPLSVTLQDLANIIAKARPQGLQRPFVVAIDGLAGAGKSSLALGIAAKLPSSTIVETDWFVRFTRAERMSSDFSAVHPDWYDIERLHGVLTTVHRKEDALISGAYDHETAAHTKMVQLRLRSTKYLLVDGMYSTSDEMADVVDLRIHLTSNSAVLRQRFINRDRLRGVIDICETIRRERQINSEEAKSVLSLAETKADLVVRSQFRDKCQIMAGSRPVLGLVASTVSWRYSMTHLEVCPLCAEANPTGRFGVRGRFQAIYNIAPIVPGHILIAPLRHITSLHDLDDGERAEFFSYAYEMTRHVNIKTATTQFDWALQDGAAAGQTLGHLHLHILPRRDGDIDRPGSWFVSLFGQESSAPDSDERSKLSEEQLEKAVAWMTG